MKIPLQESNDRFEITTPNTNTQYYLRVTKKGKVCKTTEQSSASDIDSILELIEAIKTRHIEQEDIDSRNGIRIIQKVLEDTIRSETEYSLFKFFWSQSKKERVQKLNSTVTQLNKLLLQYNPKVEMVWLDVYSTPEKSSGDFDPRENDIKNFSIPTFKSLKNDQDLCEKKILRAVENYLENDDELNMMKSFIKEKIWNITYKDYPFYYEEVCLSEEVINKQLMLYFHGKVGYLYFCFHKVLYELSERVEKDELTAKKAKTVFLEKVLSCVKDGNVYKENISLSLFKDLYLIRDGRIRTIDFYQRPVLKLLKEYYEGKWKNWETRVLVTYEIEEDFMPIVENVIKELFQNKDFDDVLSRYFKVLT